MTKTANGQAPRPRSPKPPLPPLTTKPRAIELREREAEIANRLRDMRDIVGLSNADIGEVLGLSAAAIKKIMGGAGITAFAKLAMLATALQTTPNDILGFSEGWDSERLEGILEAVFVALDKSAPDAKETAQAIVQALAQPIRGIPGISAKDIARIQTQSVVRQASRGLFGTRRDG